jgi:predicted N-acetyltransferase YhbS
MMKNSGMISESVEQRWWRCINGVKTRKKEEYGFSEDFVYEVFKNTTYSNGLAEKALVRGIREKPYYIPPLDVVVEDEGVIIGTFKTSN